jgi:hypothetical protein
MRLAHVLPLSFVLLVATFWFPAPLHAQAALYAAPVPETRGTAAADELAPDVKLRLARLVEARDLYAVHSRTLLELRISPGSELRDSRIAAELCRAAEADAAAIEEHAWRMAQSVPPAASRWLEPLAQRARASRMAAAELRAAVESPVALAHKKPAQTRAAGPRRLKRDGPAAGGAEAGPRRDDENGTVAGCPRVGGLTRRAAS